VGMEEEAGVGFAVGTTERFGAGRYREVMLLLVLVPQCLR
jgi:hypothetical protein